MGRLTGADYRSKTSSSSRCGAEAYLALVGPSKKPEWPTIGEMTLQIRRVTRPPPIASPDHAPVRVLTTLAASCPAVRSTAAVDALGYGHGKRPRRRHPENPGRG